MSITDGPGRDTARYWVALTVAGGLFGVVIVVTSLVGIPYYTFEPGSAVPTAGHVRVDPSRPTFAPEGDLFFLTARLGDDVPLLAAVTGWADRSIDLLPVEAVRGDRSAAENDADQVEAMTASQRDAVAVALDQLGIPRAPTGNGAVVVEVVPASPADGVLEVAEVIVAVDGASIATTDDLFAALEARAAGDTVALGIEDFAGDTRETRLTLGVHPDASGRAYIGIVPDTRDYQVGEPFPILFDIEDVGGPSAGLAFTLAIIDLLTEGELTGGRAIAVTGAIDRTGRVIAVGAVAQKAAAAAAARAEVMIVPAGEEEAAERLGYDLEIVGVETVEDALDALVDLGGVPLPPVPATTSH